MRPGPAFGSLFEKAKPVGVTVRAAPRGRVTGFEVACPEHGKMPVLAPSRGAGRLAAHRHVLAEHDGRGNVVDLGERRARGRRRA